MSGQVEEGGRVALTVRVEQATAQALRELARRRRRSVSDLAADLLHESLSRLAEDRLDGPALPAVRDAVESALIPHMDRLAALIAKTHLEAGIAERLTFVLIAQAFGEEKARRFLDAAWAKTIEALKKPPGTQPPYGNPPAGDEG